MTRFCIGVLLSLLILPGCREPEDPKETGGTDTVDSEPVDTETEDSDADDSGDPPVDADSDGYPAAEDCNDGDAAIHPGAAELCDYVDNDCDGETDENAVDAPTWYVDADADGYGGEDFPLDACEQPGGYVDNHSDCNDLDASIHPAAEETCDGWDNDCDGATDESDATDASTWTVDGDGDGYGGDGDTTQSCNQPPGYVLYTGDCDDTDPRYNPSALEADCTDPADYNCDGSVGFADADGDGFAACEECDDSDADVNENADEVCDSVDNDCDGDVDEDATDATVFYGDADGDGHGGSQFTAISCTAPTGYVVSSDDCDDLDASSYPGAQESCDLADNDCDGSIDEGVGSTWYQDADSDGYGNGSVSTVACTAPTSYVSNSLDCDDYSASTHPGSYEICDSVDNDCDGSVDEDAINTSTWYADADGDGYGDSASPTEACNAPSAHVANSGDCDDGNGSVNPGTDEVCDAVDNDCDGSVDEAGAVDATTWYVDADGDGYGVSGANTTACTQPTGYADNTTDCNDSDSASTSTDVDADCDGVLTAADCDDADATSHTVATDGDCDGVLTADDCDDSDSGSTVVAEDADCDGVLALVDCDDSNASAGSSVGDGDCDGVPTALDCDDGDSSSTTVATDGDCDGVLTASDCDDSDSAVVYCNSCHQFIQNHPGAADGTYTIDLDGSGGSSPFSIYCDMTQDSGGWALVARMTTASGEAHYNTAAVSVPTTGIQPNVTTTQKFADSTINAIQAASPYTGTTSYRMTCWDGQSNAQTMYCSTSCSFDATVSVYNGNCSRCTGSYEGSLVQFSPNGGTRGLGHHHDHSYAWSMAYQRHPEGNNPGCRSDAKGSGDGHLWVK